MTLLGLYMTRAMFRFSTKGAAVLTLDLTAGETPLNRGAELKAGSDRAKDQLRLAASIKDTAYNPYSGELVV